ncbi:serine/threonine-protein kinase [Candidatus Uabimicrobium amorphum]|uniref:non-specific serine/threonine protein kinase n=1 Tax=Uabimicrobium amorphum TaxID=2596890 RepID=A0A5S9IJ67_UABAM|nr:serine/threonine-protein kinase [Candidatus Uabimicrobium amorphum]BBM82694.1 protein kinase [Candidatus Uabimicrobium amorphum]
MIENDDLDDSFFETPKNVEEQQEQQENTNDKYTIIKELGRGGMGVVYLARNNDLMRNIAIKFVLDATSQKRFLREAKAIARLSHPNITKIHHLDFEDENPYIEMEYVDGCDLTDYIDHSSMAFDDRVRLFLSIVDAVAYAHSHNVIHRDIKPSNILVSREGTPYLMDFGLAKITNVADKSLTKTGVTIGSPGYMSPEQAEGLRRKINTLSDVYSLGGVLYFMCCGQPPIRGGSAVEILWNSVEAQVEPPRNICPEMPEPLERICLKALQKNPENRYQSAQQLGDDLRSYLKSGNISVGRKHLWWIRHRRKVISWLLICCFAVSFVTWKLGNRRQELAISITQKESALKSIRNGFYDEAVRELHLAHKSEQLSVNDYNMYMAFVYARLRNTKLFHKHYANINLSQKNAMMMRLAKGEVLYHEKNAQGARDQFLFVWKNAREEIQQAYAGYYLGQLYLHEQDYQQAFDILLKTKQKIQNESFLFHHQLLFFLGKTEFHLGKNNLKNLQEALPKLPNFAPLYLYLGRMHSRNSNDEKALDFLQKCLSINERDDRAYVCVADILQRQGRYAQALSTYHKARRINNKNIEAMNGIAQVVSKNMPQMERYYAMILQELEGASFTPPKILEKYFVSKRGKYASDYKLQQKLLHYDVDLKQLLIKLESKDRNILDSAEKALFLSRYNPRLQEVLGKKNSALCNKILDFKKQEQQKVLRYMLLEAHFQSHMLEKISQQTLVATVENAQELVMYRYLAALALIRKLQFQKVKMLATEGIQKIICCAALQYADIQIKTDIPPQKFSDEFSQILSVKTLSSDSQYAQKVLESRSEEKAFFIARSLVNTSHSLAEKARKKLVALTKSRNPQIRSNAYYCLFSHFWQPQKDALPLLEELWLHGMQDPDENVRLAIMEKTPKYLITNKIRALLNDLKPNRNLATLEKIKIIKTLADKYCLESLNLYYEDKQEDPIIRMYALDKQVVTLMRMALLSNKKIMQEFVRENFVDIDVFLQSDNIFLRAYGYMIYSAMLGEVLNFIDKEQDNNVRGAIILSSSIGEGASGSSFLKLAQNFVRRFFKRKVAPRKHQQEKMEIIKKFLDSSSANLNLSAHFGCAYYGSNALRKKIYQKVKDSRNDNGKKGVAMALFYRIRDKIEHLDLRAQFEFYLGIISFAKKDYLFSRIYKKQLKNKQRLAYYQQGLSRILMLDPNYPSANYYMALVHLAQGNSQDAEKYLYKAIDKEDRFLFFVELVNILWKRDRKIPKEITSKMLEIVKQRKVYPGMLGELLHITTPEIHRILRQNYLFYTLLNNQKFALDKKIAYDNLISFEKSK